MNSKHGKFIKSQKIKIKSGEGNVRGNIVFLVYKLYNSCDFDIYPVYCFTIIISFIRTCIRSAYITIQNKI